MTDRVPGTVTKVSDVSGDIHVDAYLTTYSLGFQQAPSQFISGRASTNIPVMKESDKYVIYPRGYFWRDEARVRPLGGRPVQVGYKVDSATYNAEEWALETTVDDRQRANADQPVNLEENATILLTQKQMIREDRIWATEFFATGKWSVEETGGTEFTPFDDASSNPIATIDRLKTEMAQSTGFMPNTIVCGANVKDALRTNAEIQDVIKYTQFGVASDAVLAQAFEVQQFMVARSVYNSSVETSDDDGGLAMEFIADPNALWLGYVAPTAGLNTPTAIARFAWTGLIPGATNNLGGVITRGRDSRAYSDWFHSRAAYALKQVSADLGIFLNNARNPVSN